MISFKRYITEVASPTPGTQTGGGTNYAAALQKGANPIIYTYWNTIKPKYPNIKSWGIWGDKAHQQRKSDHNTGDAIDVAISNTQEGNNIVRDTIAGNASGPYAGYVKYIIFNRQIWNPSQGTRPYKGSNPHSTHVHVSFNRGAGAAAGDANQWPGGGGGTTPGGTTPGGTTPGGTATGSQGGQGSGGGVDYDSPMAAWGAIDQAVGQLSNFMQGKNL